MSRKFVFYHGAVALVLTGSLYYNSTHVKIPRTEMFRAFHLYGGVLRYLTVWNMIIQAFFFWLCLVNDFFGSNKINPKQVPAIRKFKDKLFCTIAFPLSVFVAVTFWGLYAIDRELVLPKVLDLYFPTWLNHIMHTCIIVFSMIELVCAFRLYPTRKQGLLTLSSFMLVYLVWMFVVYFKSGEWVYPVLQVLNWPQRIAFFLGLLLLVQSFYLLGDVLNSLVWRSEFKKIESNRRSEKRKAH